VIFLEAADRFVRMRWNLNAAPKVENPALAVATAFSLIRTISVPLGLGDSHRVMVLEDGFAYAGKTYGSLSEIARLITGARWNGPRFFGLRSDQRRLVRPAQTRATWACLELRLRLSSDARVHATDGGSAPQLPGPSVPDSGPAAQRRPNSRQVVCYSVLYPS